MLHLVVMLAGTADVPVVVVDRDDVVVTASCRVVIPAGMVIHDANGDGVIHIRADGVRVEFAEGSVLAGREGIDRWLSDGAGEGEGWDTLTGTAIVVDGKKDVEIVGARVRGYRVGLMAVGADGLVVRDAEFTDMWRQRLTSTATREGSGDWLWPHRNDGNEWLTNYAAAVWVENTEKPTLEGVRVRRGQNGIVLDASNNGVLERNDCSFLSGWGLAMWRASGHLIRGNRFDFCVRGHVEGVYNRGQDSAGILMFEACFGNSVVGNSVTHGGDGVFGFGGNDAIETVQDGPWGNFSNQFISNDLSFAPAHGLEMTFSENVRIAFNLFEGNAICGIWGGYSRGMLIESNRFIENGGMAYGAERGGINIEHGSSNIVWNNRFVNNRCGVRLWWDDDRALLAKPGVRAGYRGVTQNSVERNEFAMDASHPFPIVDGRPAMVGIEIVDIGEAAGYEGARVGENAALESENSWRIDPVHGQAMRMGEGIRLVASSGNRVDGPPMAEPPARRSPSGRAWIVVDAWGPWDFQTPVVREHSRVGGRDLYEVYVPVGSDVMPRVEVDGAVVEVVHPEGGEGWRAWRVSVKPRKGAVVSSYTGRIRVGDGWSRPIAGRFVDAAWTVRAWDWTNDPLADAGAWRDEARGVEAVTLNQLDLAFGNGSPASVEARLGVTGRDRFGLVAQTEIALPPGRWRVRTLSDDGVRVFVDGVMVIERWDIHGPTGDVAEFEVTGRGPTRIGVEYFENSGFATLRVGVERAEGGVERAEGGVERAEGGVE
jgi:hypothetical protein